MIQREARPALLFSRWNTSLARAWS